MRHLLNILAIALFLALLTLWLCAPLMAADKPSFSPVAALGSYSIKPETSGKEIDMRPSPAPSGQSGFSPEITIGGQTELRYQLLHH